MAEPFPTETKQKAETPAAARPGLWRRLVNWTRARETTLMTLPDTPHSIALGSALGIFFGFTPLFGMKTLLSIAVAWLFRCNKIAAVITVTLHDLLLPFVPAMVFWQYKLGMWALHGRMPHRAALPRLSLHDYMQWTTFFTMGQPLLVGSLFFAVPASLLVYFGLRAVLIRSRAKSAGS